MGDATDGRLRLGPGVLVVDDSAYARRRVRRFLEAIGCTNVAEAEDGDEALRLFERDRHTLVLLDQVMRGKHGIETAKLILDQAPEVCVVLFTVVSDPAIVRVARATGVRHVLTKTSWEALRAVVAEQTWS